MKNYTKEQIKQIVLESSNCIMKENTKLFVENSIKAVEGKENNEALLIMFSLIYNEVQRNCEDTIIEVLNKILNDE